MLDITQIHQHFIKNRSLTELETDFTKLGIPKYRAAQIYLELYSQRAGDFSQMLTLPKELRDRLADIYLINSISGSKVQKSSDGTQKFLFELAKGSAVESVLIPCETENEIPDIKRMTLCVSSQVGCALNCAFCATGKLKFGRNLMPAEIVDQVLFAEKLSGSKITNIVFMGMGEPLHNYKNVLKAIDILTNDTSKVISRKKITISTSGIVPKIKDLANEIKTVKLAVSLHATTNGLKAKIMPVAEKWSIRALREAIIYYYTVSQIPVTYEYILFDKFNDSLEDAVRLARFVRSVPSKVNIIPFHDIGFTHPEGIASELKPASHEKILLFAKELRNLGVHVFIRTSSGFDIDAACGQLAFSNKGNIL